MGGFSAVVKLNVGGETSLFAVVVVLVGWLRGLISQQCVLVTGLG